MITITHTPAEGTLIDGTSRGDGTNVILSPLGWRWSRSLSSWYVPRSRDTTPNLITIERTADQLRSDGHDVTVEVDDTRRSTAEVEDDKIDRQQQRTEHLTARAERIAAAADQADHRAHDIAGRVPFGQPILVGHHSEGRMRAHYRRVETAQRTAVELDRAATTAAAAAGSAAATTGARYSPVTVANRIDRLGAELRAAQRSHDHAARAGHSDSLDRLAGVIADLTDQLGYWQDVRNEQIDAGTATNYGPDTVRPGDLVRIRGTWRKVVHANKKTVSVETGYSWTDTTPYHEIQAQRRPGSS